MTKQDLTASDPFALTNISVRLFQVQRDLIDMAAELWANGRDTSLSDYIREVLTERAAADLKVPIPTVPDITRGRGGSIERQAAAKLGMSLEEFTASVLRKAASDVLGANAIDDSRASSAPPARKPSGTYARGSVAPEAVVRPKRVTGR